jgi:membrane-bound ClpP family serine protease
VFDSKTILKYIALHLAELVVLVLGIILVRYFFGIPNWSIIVIISLWIVKDIVLFPKVWRAYAYNDNRPMNEFIGLEATVADGLHPAGYVRVHGELWKAEVSDRRQTLKRGERTRVVDSSGMTLIVERLP